MMYWEFVLEDKALGRALDSMESSESPSGSTWSSSSSDPFGF